MQKPAEITAAGNSPEMPSGVRRRLLTITIALAILTVVHDLDHVRQARGLPFELYGLAVLALVTIGVTLTLLLQRRRLAATVAVAQGVVTVVGVAAIHVAPSWSSLTDPYSAAHADALSWAIILTMMLLAAALALTGASSALQEWPALAVWRG